MEQGLNVEEDRENTSFSTAAEILLRFSLTFVYLRPMVSFSLSQIKNHVTKEWTGIEKDRENTSFSTPPEILLRLSLPSVHLRPMTVFSLSQCFKTGVG